MDLGEVKDELQAQKERMQETMPLRNILEEGSCFAEQMKRILENRGIEMTKLEMLYKNWSKLTTDPTYGIDVMDWVNFRKNVGKEKQLSDDEAKICYQQVVVGFKLIRTAKSLAGIMPTTLFFSRDSKSLIFYAKKKSIQEYQLRYGILGLPGSALGRIIDLRPSGKKKLYVNGTHEVVITRKHDAKTHPFRLNEFWALLRFYDMCFFKFVQDASPAKEISLCKGRGCKAAVILLTCRFCATCCSALCQKCASLALDEGSQAPCCKTTPRSYQHLLEIMLSLQQIAPVKAYTIPDGNSQSFDSCVDSFKNRSRNAMFQTNLEDLTAFLLGSFPKALIQGQNKADIDLLTQKVNAIAKVDARYKEKVLPTLPVIKLCYVDRGIVLYSNVRLTLSANAKPNLGFKAQIIGDMIRQKNLRERYTKIQHGVELATCFGCSGIGLVGGRLQFVCPKCLKLHCHKCFKKHGACFPELKSTGMSLSIDKQEEILMRHLTLQSSRDRLKALKLWAKCFALLQFKARIKSWLVKLRRAYHPAPSRTDSSVSNLFHQARVTNRAEKEEQQECKGQPLALAPSSVHMVLSPKTGRPSPKQTQQNKEVNDSLNPVVSFLERNTALNRKVHDRDCSHLSTNEQSVEALDPHLVSKISSVDDEWTLVTNSKPKRAHKLSPELVEERNLPQLSGKWRAGAPNSQKAEPKMTSSDLFFPFVVSKRPSSNKKGSVISSRTNSSPTPVTRYPPPKSAAVEHNTPKPVDVASMPQAKAWQIKGSGANDSRSKTLNAQTEPVAFPSSKDFPLLVGSSSKDTRAKEYINQSSAPTEGKPVALSMREVNRPHGSVAPVQDSGTRAWGADSLKFVNKIKLQSDKSKPLSPSSPPWKPANPETFDNESDLRIMDTSLPIPMVNDSKTEPNPADCNSLQSSTAWKTVCRGQAKTNRIEQIDATYYTAAYFSASWEASSTKDSCGWATLSPGVDTWQQNLSDAEDFDSEEDEKLIFSNIDYISQGHEILSDSEPAIPYEECQTTSQNYLGAQLENGKSENKSKPLSPSSPPWKPANPETFDNESDLRIMDTSLPIPMVNDSKTEPNPAYCNSLQSSTAWKTVCRGQAKTNRIEQIDATYYTAAYFSASWEASSTKDSCGWATLSPGVDTWQQNLSDAEDFVSEEDERSTFSNEGSVDECYCVADSCQEENEVLCVAKSLRGDSPSLRECYSHDSFQSVISGLITSVNQPESETQGSEKQLPLPQVLPQQVAGQWLKGPPTVQSQEMPDFRMRQVPSVRKQSSAKKKSSRTAHGGLSPSNNEMYSHLVQSLREEPRSFDLTGNESDSSSHGEPRYITSKHPISDKEGQERAHKGEEELSNDGSEYAYSSYDLANQRLEFKRNSMQVQGLLDYEWASPKRTYSSYKQLNEDALASSESNPDVLSLPRLRMEGSFDSTGSDLASQDEIDEQETLPPPFTEEELDCVTEKNLHKFLENHGFTLISQRHHRKYFRRGYGNIIVSSTPSDRRFLLNLRGFLRRRFLGSSSQKYMKTKNI